MIDGNTWNDRDVSDLAEYVTIEQKAFVEAFYPELAAEFKAKTNSKDQPKRSI